MQDMAHIPGGNDVPVKKTVICHGLQTILIGAS
jgi:hypothetical protein